MGYSPWGHERVGHSELLCMHTHTHTHTHTLGKNWLVISLRLWLKKKKKDSGKD